MKLGSHMSSAGGVDKALLRGQKIGCQTIQLFTKKNNLWKAPQITEEERSLFFANIKQTGISPVVAHDGYLINLGTPHEENLKKSLEAFIDEIKRAETLNIPYLVMHPGSHLNSGEEAGLKRIAANLNTALKQTKDARVIILLETTAGQGTNLGYKFEHLAEMIALINNKKRIGVCLDTCHIFAAGYDIRDKQSYTDTIKKFDTVIGLDKLKVIHLNDAKKDLGSKVDRHEHIGKGAIGLGGFKLLLNDERLKEVPLILETPKDKEMIEDIENLRVLKSLLKKK